MFANHIMKSLPRTIVFILLFIPYLLPAQVKIEKGVTLCSVNGAEGTVLDGRGLVRCVYLAHRAARVEGFTLRGGRAEYGGGEIWFDNELIRKDGFFIPHELQCLNPENLV